MICRDAIARGPTAPNECVRRGDWCVERVRERMG